MTSWVIGAGNADCGDDAAGLLAVRRVAARAVPGVSCLESPSDALALLSWWSAAPLVVVVDAACSGSPPGTILRFDARAGPLPAELRPFSSHGFGIVEAVELARTLGRLPARLVVYGIEGAQFAPGDTVSPAVAAAVERLVDLVLGECARSP